MKIFHLLSILLLFSFVTKAQGFEKALSLLPPLPNSGEIIITAEEQSEKNKLIITLIKPDVVSLDKLYLMNDNKILTYSLHWDKGQDKNDEILKLVIPLTIFDFSKPIELGFFNKGKIVMIYELEQRLKWRANSFQFYQQLK